MYSAYKLNKQGDNIQPWRTPFPIWNQFHTICNGCFLTCTPVSHEAGKTVWYSHLFKNFPQFFVIYTVNGFSIVNEAEVDVFLYSLAFSMIQQMLAICSLVPLPFLNPACTPGSSQFTYCWSLAWRILSITLLACEMNVVVWTFLGISLFGIGMKTDFFQSCGHCWFFHCGWHAECSAVTASSFRIWKSSAGILSPPLALFIVMLPNPAWCHTPGYLQSPFAVILEPKKIKSLTVSIVSPSICHQDGTGYHDLNFLNTEF